MQLLSQRQAVRQLPTKPFHLYCKMGKRIYEKTHWQWVYFPEHQTIIYRNTSEETELLGNISLPLHATLSTQL